MQFFGVDPLQAGNVVQLILVLGLTLGWISTYIFRVSNKEMTYAQQLRDYEKKVMEVWFLNSPFPSSLHASCSKENITYKAKGEGGVIARRNLTFSFDFLIKDMIMHTRCI